MNTQNLLDQDNSTKKILPLLTTKNYYLLQ